MNLLDKSDDEIIKIANPIWENLVRSSNNKLLTSLSENQEFLGCIRRDKFITVLYRQKSNTVSGEFLGRLVLGLEGDMVKVFGATIY